MKNLIVSTFPACGKTYLANHQNDFNYNIIDADSLMFKGENNWKEKYANYIITCLEKFDIVLITQQFDVLDLLTEKKQHFITVAPKNEKYMSSKEKQIIKQQWFGRFYLRDNSQIKDLNSWMKKIEINYDKWTNPEIILKHGSMAHFSLDQNEYLTDIIEIIIKNFNYSEESEWFQ